jgi:hypothetical protein
MISIRRLMPIPALAVGLLAFNCKKGTEPTAVDPTAMVTSVNGLGTAFTQNAVFQSLAALSGHFTLSAPAARPLTAPIIPGPWTASGAADRERMLPLADRAPAAILALFPVNVLGKTFQWDTAGGGKYRIIDSTLTGAAANGVRYILYQADTATRRPRLPLTTTGFVDLIDASTPQANVLHLVLRVGTQTAADYTITEVKTTTSLTLTASGYVVDVVAGGTPVNFTLTHVLTLADSGLVTDYAANGNAGSVTMHTGYSGAGGNNVVLDWIVQKNGSLEVAGTETPTAINFQFKFNGTSWAAVNGDPGNPTFTGAGGRQLSASELLEMGQILQGFASVAVNLSGVFGPGFLVFK